MPAPDYAKEIAELDRAIGTGELTIESEGERVTYRSMSDLKEARRHFASLAASANPATARGSSFGFSAVGFDRE